MPRLLTVNQAAAEIGVGRSKLWQWITDGRLPSIKVDGMRRIRREDIDVFMDSLHSERPGRHTAKAAQ